MKALKKVLAVAMTFALVCSLAGCGNKDGQAEVDIENTPTNEEVVDVTPTPSDEDIDINEVEVEPVEEEAVEQQISLPENIETDPDTGNYYFNDSIRIITEAETTLEDVDAAVAEFGIIVEETGAGEFVGNLDHPYSVEELDTLLESLNALDIVTEATRIYVELNADEPLENSDELELGDTIEEDSEHVEAVEDEATETEAVEVEADEDVAANPVVGESTES